MPKLPKHLNTMSKSILNCVLLLCLQSAHAQMTTTSSCFGGNVKDNCVITHLLQILQQVSLGQCVPTDDVKAELSDVSTKIDDVSTKLDNDSTKLDAVETNLDDMNTKTDDLSAKLDDVNTKIESLISTNTYHINVSDIDNRLRSLDAKVDTILNQFDFDPTMLPMPDDGAQTLERWPKSCADVKAQGEMQSGVYIIAWPTVPEPRDFRHVYCDMDTDGGGWTMIQRRQDGSTTFRRAMAEYRQGFGSVSAEHWLGLEYLHQVTEAQRHELRIDLGDHEGEWRYAQYDYFHVTPYWNQLCKLTIGTYSGTAGDSLSFSNGTYFSTADDAENQSYRNCAVNNNLAGFWYQCESIECNICAHAHLNNEYHDSSTVPARKGITWDTWHGEEYSLKYVQMKIRPIQ